MVRRNRKFVISASFPLLSSSAFLLLAFVFPFYHFPFLSSLSIPSPPLQYSSLPPLFLPPFPILPPPLLISSPFPPTAFSSTLLLYCIITSICVLGAHTSCLGIFSKYISLPLDYYMRWIFSSLIILALVELLFCH